VDEGGICSCPDADADGYADAACSGGTDCNDANACTIDTCHPTLGCRNTPIPACCTTNANCADASACTVNERCVAGQCLSDPLICDDGTFRRFGCRHGCLLWRTAVEP